MLRQSAFLNWRTTGATGAGQVPVRQCASPFRGLRTGAARHPRSLWTASVESFGLAQAFDWPAAGRPPA
jgi:hypothetical protein